MSKESMKETRSSLDRLKNEAGSIVLSSGETLKQKVARIVQARATAQIGEATRFSSLSLEDARKDLVQQKTKERQEKERLLQLMISENDPDLAKQAVYLANYISVLDNQIANPDISKAKKQKEAGNRLLERLTTEAIRKTRKALNNTNDPEGVPLISGRPIVEPIAFRVPILDLSQLIKLCPELSAITANSNTKNWPDFLCWCYAIGTNDPLTKEKSSAIRIMGSRFQETFGINIQLVYTERIDQYIREQLKENDLVNVLITEEEDKLYRKLSGLAERSNKETALCYWELELNSNDEFLNPDAVLRVLKAAKVGSRTLVIRFIRSLRWCYPNRELEIPPTAGDWQTKDVNGNPITRKESTEIEKLKIFRIKLLDILDYYKIPYSTVLLSTGDYEMTGPGYGFSEEDMRCQAARAYVEDLKTRIPQWGIFRTKVTIQSVKELIATNKRLFDEMAQKVRSGIESLFDVNQRVLDYCGYTDMSMGWVFEKEDNNRTPFIKWWTRKRSLEFTKYKTWFEMALGLFIANLDDNCLLVVSGNRASGLPLSKSRLIDSKQAALGVISLKLVNDGEISADFATKTERI